MKFRFNKKATVIVAFFLSQNSLNSFIIIRNISLLFSEFNLQWALNFANNLSSSTTTILLSFVLTLYSAWRFALDFAIFITTQK